MQVYQNDTKIAEATLGGESSDVVAITQQVRAVPIAAGMKDAAVARDLAPGAYTVQVRNTDGASGVVLVEVYDASTQTDADTSMRLINISTRGKVGTGDQQMIAGFIITGDSPKKVLVRVVGPTLQTFNVTGFLADPKFELRDSTGIVATNDDWNNAADVVQASSVAKVFPLNAGSHDAALVRTLSPGAYTVVASGASGSTGVALIEVYEVLE